VFTWKCLPFVLPVLLGGCVHGFDSTVPQQHLNVGTPPPDATVAEAPGTKPQLPSPCRIAVYLIPGDHDWQWTPEDNAAMEQWEAALKKEGIVADVFPIAELLTGKGDLRLIAAKRGADALFVIHGTAQTESHKSTASVFDFTILGGYVIPSNHLDSRFAIEGVLLDVNTGDVYTTVRANGEGKIVRPTFLAESKHAVARAKTKAVAQFGPEVVTRMRALAPDRTERVIIEGTTPAPNP
jgi:rhombotail lipoprotein